MTSEITGSDGTSPAVTAKDGEVIVGSAGSNFLLIVIGALAAVVVAGGGGAAFVMKRARAA